MGVSVSVRNLDGKKLQGTAGRHSVITDRKPDDGGEDAGCTSGELLLLAIGSCASSGVRRFLQARQAPPVDFQVDVSLQPSPTGQERDMILISVMLPGEVLSGGEAALEDALLAGRVVSRVALGSEMEIRCRPKESQQQD